VCVSRQTALTARIVCLAHREHVSQTAATADKKQEDHKASRASNHHHLLILHPVGLLRRVAHAQRQLNGGTIAVVVLLHDEELVVLAGVGGSDEGHLLVSVAAVDVHSA